MNSIKVKFNQKDEDLKTILQAMGHKDKTVSLPAMEIFAAFVGELIDQTLDQAGTRSLVYQNTFTYTSDELPIIPLDAYEGVNEGYIDIWSQAQAGGLPTNRIEPVSEDFRLPTIDVETAWNIGECYLRKARFDVVARALRHVMQEILVKLEVAAWTPILMALAQGRTGGSVNIIDATRPDELLVHDISRMWLQASRLRSSWVGGTPLAVPTEGLTHIFLSPEMIAEVRAFAYNPQNVTAAPNTDESTALGLPNGVREEIFRNGGLPQIWGLKFIELFELGVGQNWNILFNEFYTQGGGEPGFTQASDEIVLGLDLSAEDAFVSCVETDDCRVSNFEVAVDDQFPARAKRRGWYTKGVTGHAVMDHKAITGCVI